MNCPEKGEEVWKTQLEAWLMEGRGSGRNQKIVEKKKTTRVGRKEKRGD